VEAKVFGWLGTTRRRVVIEQVTALVQAWWNAWAFMPATVQADEELVGAEKRCSNFHGRGEYALRIDDDLAGALTGITDREGGHLAEFLTSAALLDLIRRLDDADGKAEPVLVDAEQVPETLRDPRWGGCSLTLRCADLRLSLWMDRRVVERWTAPAAVRAVPLSSRVQSVASTRTRVDATLDLGEISLDQLQGLVPGDVLATTAPLTRLPEIFVAGSRRRLFHGRLGERDGYRALRLLPIDVQESL
jgi:hypothetical protein